MRVNSLVEIPWILLYDVAIWNVFGFVPASTHLICMISLFHSLLLCSNFVVDVGSTTFSRAAVIYDKR